MKKSLIQGIIIALVFISIWLCLTQIKWVSIFEIEKKTDSLEKELGELLIKEFETNKIENTFITNTIDSLVTNICKANKIDSKNIKPQIIKTQEINALALPDGHLIIYSNLIAKTKNQEELAAVICHEIAHIQLNHIMKKLVREIGLSVLISTVTGKNSESIGEIVKTISSSAFDRSLEKDADLKAIDYLLEAKINPEAFANFLYSLSIDKNNDIINLSWISSHPELEKRAKYIIEYSKDKQPEEFHNILNNSTWKKLKEELNKIELEN